MPLSHSRKSIASQQFAKKRKKTENRPHHSFPATCTAYYKVKQNGLSTLEKAILLQEQKLLTDILDFSLVDLSQ